MMEKTVIINRKISASEQEEIKQLQKDAYSIFFISDTYNEVFVKQLSLSAEQKKQVNYDILEEVISFGDVEIGDSTISDLFRIGKASLWHYQKFRIYFAVRNLMYFFKTLELNFDNYKNHIWYVSDEYKPLTALFQDVKFVFTQNRTRQKFNFKDMFLYFATLKWRLFVYLFSIRKTPENLIYITEKYSNILEKKTLKSKKGHHVLEYLMSETDDSFELITEVILPKPKGKSDYTFSFNQIKIRWNSNKKIFLEGVLLSGIMKRSVRQSIKEAKVKIENSYSKIQLNDLSQIHKITFLLFRSLNKSTEFYLARYFSACNYFAKSDIKSIVATDENSPLTKSVLDAAKFNGIKVIGIQHGTMHDLHPAYIYTQSDAKNKIMPDLTLTWGKYWEDFLIRKGNYPANSVKSVGQLRTDIIPELLEKKASVKSSLAKVVFASQPQRDPELRYRAAFDVFKAVSQIDNIKLIIRLHPREISDRDYYNEIAHEAACSNYIFDQQSDLYELIASCDIVITCFSTVGTETVYFHKPLIVLDHLEQDIASYVAEKVAFSANNYESLKGIISSLLDGSIKPDKVMQDKFIEKYANVIDGKVAERCISEITLF